MTEGEESLINPVDWNYPINHFNTKNYLTQESLYDEEDEDDDIDSYYMDLPPIDMTERLKEVNRALAEDATPIESNRTTKLRFRDIIAEYQSPRDSDSDDGYGDSSEIMFDAEDENDLIYPGTSGKGSTKILELPEENKISEVDKEEEDSKFQEVNFSAPVAATEEVRIKSILAPSTKDEPSSSDEEIPEEDVVEILEAKPLKLLGHTSINVDEDEEKLFKLSSPIEFHNLPEEGDEDVFEVESDISEEIEVETTNHVNEVEKPSEPSQNTDKPNKDFSVYLIDNVKDKENSTSLHDIFHGNKSLPDNLKQKLETDSVESKSSTMVNTSIKIRPDSASHKSRNKKSITNDNIKTTKLKTNKIEEQPSSKHNQIPTIKQSLSPYEISAVKDLKHKKYTPNTLGTNEHRKNRSRLNAFHVSPTKTPSGAQVQSTRSNRENRARKGSPVPQRTSRFQDKKPVKAVHNQSLSNLNTSDMSSNKKSKYSKPNFSQNGGVRKAASTSDLCRSSSEDEDKINNLVYDKWLQQKNREAALSKRQQEESKAAEKSAAVTKVEERKRLAEEAFQQWLRRKREQLKMERKMKMQQRKLDHQTTYAKTRFQCEEAYKEWCKRKSEETNARKAAGGGPSNFRSQSLERTWIQEKTRKLYNAYISK